MEKKSINNLIIDLTNNINDSETKVKYKKDAFENYKGIADAYPSLDLGESNSLFLEYIRSKDSNIKDIIFKCYLKEIYKLCEDAGDIKNDLISEGYVLLYQIIDLYDPRDYKDVPFICYLRMFLSTLYERIIRTNEEALEPYEARYKLLLEQKNVCKKTDR